jgi:hypothetical protein
MCEIHSLVGTKKVQLQITRYNRCGVNKLVSTQTAEAGVITFCNIPSGEGKITLELAMKVQRESRQLFDLSTATLSKVYINTHKKYKVSYNQLTFMTNIYFTFPNSVNLCYNFVLRGIHIV